MMGREGEAQRRGDEGRLQPYSGFGGRGWQTWASVPSLGPAATASQAQALAGKHLHLGDIRHRAGIRRPVCGIIWCAICMWHRGCG